MIRRVEGSRLEKFSLIRDDGTYLSVYLIWRITVSRVLTDLLAKQNF